MIKLLFLLLFPLCVSTQNIIWSDDCSDPTTWTFTNSSIPPLDWNWTNNTNVQSQCITPLPTSLQDLMNVIDDSHQIRSQFQICNADKYTLEVGVFTRESSSSYLSLSIAVPGKILRQVIWKIHPQIKFLFCMFKKNSTYFQNQLWTKK